MSTTAPRDSAISPTLKVMDRWSVGNSMDAILPPLHHSMAENSEAMTAFALSFVDASSDITAPSQPRSTPGAEDESMYVPSNR